MTSKKFRSNRSTKKKATLPPEALKKNNPKNNPRSKPSNKLTSKDLQKKAQNYLNQCIEKLPTLFKAKPKYLREVNYNTMHADVRIITDKRMTELNNTYRGKNTSTDVLSFMSPTPILRTTHYLGELVIAAETLNQQAQNMNHSILDELEVLICHGLLHLLGFDHEKSEKDSQIMAKLEIQLIAQNKKVSKNTVEKKFQKTQSLIERNL